MNCGISWIIRSLNACGILGKPSLQFYRCFHFFLPSRGALGTASAASCVSSLDLRAQPFSKWFGMLNVSGASCVSLHLVWSVRGFLLCTRTKVTAALVTHSYICFAHSICGVLYASAFGSTCVGVVMCCCTCHIRITRFNWSYPLNLSI